jgi:hypothetical protein
MTVMLVYQGVRLVLVGILMAAFFAVLGYLAVPPDVSTAWMIDNLVGPRSSEPQPPIYELPWVRAAVLLGAISALYVAIHSVYDDGLRAAFFEDIRPAVRRRFAVRLAYLYLIETTPPAEPPTGAGVADQDAGPPAQRAERAGQEVLDGGGERVGGRVAAAVRGAGPDGELAASARAVAGWRW